MALFQKIREYQQAKTILLDVTLNRKIEYCKRIIEFKESLKVVWKLYVSEFGKPMPYSTFDNLKTNSHDILSSDFSEVNYRGIQKKKRFPKNLKKMYSKLLTEAHLISKEFLALIWRLQSGVQDGECCSEASIFESISSQIASSVFDH